MILKIKINKDFRIPNGFAKKDQILEIEADQNNIPLNHFWRNRLADSVIDNCVEIISKEQELKKKK
jgi:hypothetical protein